MKLLFRQRMFSWFDSYDIYDENENTVYVVKGQLSWGHCLKIFDACDREVGTVRERVLTLLPKFEIYEGDSYVGCISKEFSFLKPRYDIDFNGWQFSGMGLYHYRCERRRDCIHFQGAVSHDRYLCTGYSKPCKLTACTDVRTGNGCRKVFQKLNKSDVSVQSA